jgi:hypothetical protein
MDLQDKEHFRTIDVADAGDDRLIQKQFADRGPAAVNSVPHLVRVGVTSQRVRAEPRLDRCQSAVVHQFARRRPIEIESVFVADHAQADGSAGLWRRGRMTAELPIQTQVDVQDWAVPLVKQVFSTRVDAIQDAAIDRFRPITEATLGRGDGEGPTSELSLVVAGKSVNRVAFRHYWSY